MFTFLFPEILKLWRALKLRPDFKDALHVKNNEYFTYLLGHRFGSSLEYIELPIELITTNVMHELANKCASLKYMTMDFSLAMQLQDFNDLNNFPCNLKMMTICLSEVIFLEGFMRKIYSFLSSLEILHLVGEKKIWNTVFCSQILIYFNSTKQKHNKVLWKQATIPTSRTKRSISEKLNNLRQI